MPRESRAALTPYEEGKIIRIGLDEKGRIRLCLATNPNCVSTSSVMTENYVAAIRAPYGNAEEAAGVLIPVVQRTLAAAKLEENKAAGTGNSQYIRFSIPSQFGVDSLEFLIRPESNGGSSVVTYRSVAGEVKYIWPIQQPISDGGLQKRRVQAVYDQLNWGLIGCDTLDCAPDTMDPRLIPGPNQDPMATILNNWK